ncbi:unnamed protein product [Cylicostephanus goldi]|uniref:Uncharacterized protein n=1 Tax=Cylicostephanus goldi TaxID=71465 RepID=A0A3P7MQI1_CYLGO|nr:unnamed protein product [Cylicostephanus goldi]
METEDIEDDPGDGVIIMERGRGTEKVTTVIITKGDEVEEVEIVAHRATIVVLMFRSLDDGFDPFEPFEGPVRLPSSYLNKKEGDSSNAIHSEQANGSSEKLENAAKSWEKYVATESEFATPSYDGTIAGVDVSGDLPGKTVFAAKSTYDFTANGRNSSFVAWKELFVIIRLHLRVVSQNSSFLKQYFHLSVKRRRWRI